ncbi:MAG TPA: M20/M25/M40 family metallo-hydrolase, partial [Pseudonocardia sp.]
PQALAALREVLARAGTDIDHRLDVIAFAEGSELDAADEFARYFQSVSGTAVRGLYLGTDARFLRNQLGIPTVVYGPGSMTVAHTADEYVPLAELTEAAGTFAAVYATFGSGRESGFADVERP